jgi:hypothetical protein
MRRGALIVAVVLAVGGLAFALAPFGPGGDMAIEHADGSFSLPYRCSAPIVSSFRAQPTDRSFTVLSPVPLGDTVAAPSCRVHGRDRLELAAGLWFAAGLALVLTRRPRSAAPSVAPA